MTMKILDRLTGKRLLGRLFLVLVALLVVTACNLGQHSSEKAVVEAQSTRYSAMFVGLPTPDEQTLAAKKTAHYLMREARDYHYGRPVPSLPTRGQYHEFTRHIPSFFYDELRAVARQAVRQQPLLAEADRISLAEAYQLVELDAVNDKAARMVLLFTVEQFYEDPYRYDWVARVAIDVDRWLVLGWEVNRAQPRAGYSSARSQFMGVDGQPRYVRAVLEPGMRLSALGPGRLGRIYYAELGPSESDTRIYDLEREEIYRVAQGGSGAELELVGTYEDWVPTPLWLRSP